MRKKRARLRRRDEATASEMTLPRIKYGSKLQSVVEFQGELFGSKVQSVVEFQREL